MLHEIIPANQIDQHLATLQKLTTASRKFHGAVLFDLCLESEKSDMLNQNAASATTKEEWALAPPNFSKRLSSQKSSTEVEYGNEICGHNELSSSPAGLVGLKRPASNPPNTPLPSRGCFHFDEPSTI